ncbi:MAG: hypothetical protein WBC74_05205 [Candidatus Omnitrophota bacterium]
MVILVKLIGIIVVGMGLVFVLKPDVIKQIFAYYLREKRRIYIIGVARIIIGFIFLMGASQCRVVWAIIVIGLLPLVSGISIFVLGPDKCKNILKKWQEKPLKTLRLLSLVPIIYGLLILYFA